MTTTNSKQLTQRFNKTVCELLQDIESVYPNLAESIQTFNTKYDVSLETNTTYLNYFIIHINPLSEYIASKSAELFTKSDFLEGIDIQSIMNDPESAGNQEVIWKYLESLYLLSHKYLKSLNTDDDTDENVVEQLKAMGFDESYMKEQTEQLMKIIANMQIPLAGSSATPSTTEHESETAETAETPDTNSTKPKEDVKLPPEMEKMTEQMFGGMIGNLAKEIAAGIDPSTLNIDPNNPQALLQGLLSGENSNLMGLVQNISGKLQSKIESGELNQDALFNEANSIMGNFKNMPGFEGLAGGAGGAGGFDPSMMMNMFSAMGGLGGLGGSSGTNGAKKDPNKNLSLLPKNHPKRKGAGK